MARSLLVLLPLLLLAGCGAHGPLRDRGNDYLLSAPGQPLVYPDGVPALASREAWPVPEVERRRQPAEAPQRRRDEIPRPPQVVAVDEVAGTTEEPANRPVPAARVLLTEDGNGHPVLMLDMDFNWAWQRVGDALKGIAGTRVDDLDRERAIYFLVIDGKRARGNEAYQLKLNYTANGIQAALQLDENAMASRDLALPLMQKLRDGLLQ